MPEPCARVEPLLSAWLDEELSDLERTAVEAHLTTCASCRIEGEHLRVVRSLARSLPVRRLPDEARSAVTGRVVHRSRALSRMGAALAVTVGLLSGAAFTLGDQPSPDVPTVAVPMDLYVADHFVQTVQAPVRGPVLVGNSR